MLVKELIIALLNEDMDDAVFLRTADDDVISIDGIQTPSTAPSHIAVFLATDLPVYRFGE